MMVQCCLRRQCKAIIKMWFVQGEAVTVGSKGTLEDKVQIPRSVGARINKVTLIRERKET